MQRVLLVSCFLFVSLWPQLTWGQRVFIFGIPLDGGAKQTSLTDVPQSYTWQNQWNSSYLKLNPLKFSNRAECAADSERPANGTFLLLDTYSVAMAAYRYAQATKNDPKLYAQMAVSRFRWAYIRLMQTIAKAMMDGRLPLLPSRNKVSEGGNYFKAIEGCDQDCAGLDEYIARIWDLYEKNNKNFDSLDRLKKIQPEVDLLKTGPKELSCYQLIKKSPFQGHFEQQSIPQDVPLLDWSSETKSRSVSVINGPVDSKVETKSTSQSKSYFFFNELAEAHRKQEEYLVECQELAPVDSLEGYTFQMEVMGISPDKWEQVGFDYWHSLKTYFSWAWRNSAQMRGLFNPFNHLMKSIELESMAMLLPNSCRSIARPSCDPSFFSTQMMKELTRKDFDQVATSFDFSQIYPRGPEEQMLEKPYPEINNDQLSWGNFPDMSDWLVNFRKNLTKTRGVLKSRILKSSNFLTLNLLNLTPEQIVLDIKRKIGEGALPQVGLKEQNYDLKSQLFMMCSEFIVAGDQQFGFFRKDLNLLESAKDFDRLLKDISPFKSSDFFSHFTKLLPLVLDLCKGLEKDNYFSQTKLDKSGYSEWYRLRFLDKDKSAGSLKSDTGLVLDRPLLAMKNFENSRQFSDVLCMTGIDCARETLNSLFALYGVGLYQSMILPGATVASPSLANPYAERVSCGVYDPSWGMKRAVFNLFGNTLLGFATTALPTPFFLDVDLAPGTLTSFDKLVENGHLVVKPNVSKEKLLASLGAEFGPLLGAKCAITFTNKNEPIALNSSASNIFFTGITVGGCLKNENKVSVAQGGDGKFTPTTDQSISGCASCSLNFESVGEQALSSIGEDFSKVAYPVLRGASRFIQVMQDSQNIPHGQKLDVNKVYESVKRFGVLSGGCTNLLASSQTCLGRDEAFLAEYFQWNYGVGISKITLTGDLLSVEADDCRYPLFVISYSNLRDQALNGRDTRYLIKGLETCRWGKK